jgi:hypothetical protein
MFNTNVLILQSKIPICWCWSESRDIPRRCFDSGTNSREELWPKWGTMSPMHAAIKRWRWVGPTRLLGEPTMLLSGNVWGLLWLKLQLSSAVYTSCCILCHVDHCKWSQCEGYSHPMTGKHLAWVHLWQGHISGSLLKYILLESYAPSNLAHPDSRLKHPWKLASIALVSCLYKESDSASLSFSKVLSVCISHNSRYKEGHVKNLFSSRVLSAVFYLIQFL